VTGAVGYPVPLVACDQLAAWRHAGGLRVTGRTRIHADGPYLAAHFPELAVFPGVFVLEAVVQAVARALGERAGRPLRLAEVRSLRLRRPLYPGDQLRLRADLAEVDGGVLVRADCRRGDGARVAGMTLVCRWSP
jgi:3-hydroxyacyl-[acyl-carrier-protein] dehydratase